jgi:hypothetical protein
MHKGSEQMVNQTDVRTLAEHFATALDRSDFDIVAAMLAPNCRYDLTRASFSLEGTLVGPHAIIDSYRAHDAHARRLFDKVDYLSAIEAVEGRTAVLRFTDVLEKNGERHTYHCRQRISLDEKGQIQSIGQEDIPSEIAAVRIFMTRVGLDPR